MIILTFSSHYAKRLNFSAHFAFFSPSFLLVYKSSRMAEWSALRWAGRPPGQSWGTPAASTCRSGHRQCRQFHRFLREFEICLATREIFFYLFPSHNCFQKCCLSSWGMDSGRKSDSRESSWRTDHQAGWFWHPVGIHWQIQWWSYHPRCKQAPGWTVKAASKLVLQKLLKGWLVWNDPLFKF